MKINTDKTVLTRNELAHMLGVHVTTVDNWRTTEGLPVKTVGGRCLIFVDEIEKWLEKHSEP